MRVSEIMTRDPACCTPDTALPEVARLMSDNDCGEIPVVDDMETRKLAGVVTDRDMVIRAIARDRNPASINAGDIMTTSVARAREFSSIEECEQQMEQHQVRRIPVVDDENRVVGIVAQADIARQARKGEAGEVVRDVSRPNRPNA